MMNVQVHDLELEVDAETAEELKDPKVAEAYYNALKSQMELQQSSSSNSSTMQSVFTSQLWKSSKNPTQMDHEATLALLKLRLKYNHEFTDRRSVKMQLWLKIANDLNEMGYLVGTGSDGRDKCRQKFANLQSSYVKAQDRRKLTGEGFIKNPPYFEEMDLILGDKHKTNPIFVIDSLCQNNENNPQSPTVSTAATVPPMSPPSDSSHSTVHSDGKHRFNNIKKTVRPKKERGAVLEELINIQKASHETRKIEFEAMIKMFTDQNNKRHEEMMALLKKTKKRKRSSSDKSN